MCGINGKINLYEKQVLDDEIILMNDALVHRGPDDSGIWIEKNVGLDAPDHLELVLQSTTNKDIFNITAFYIIKDAKINKTESYIKPLNGFVLKANETRTIHFDAGQKPDHFRANPNSIYYTSKEELNFTVILNSDGYEAQTIQVEKDAGGAEAPD